MSLIFVDCEGEGLSPASGKMTEFGAVEFKTRKTFYGPDDSEQTFQDFTEWLKQFRDGRPVFVSDNPAYDWQWINYGFDKYLKYNPFGHSARRISDFYAGLKNDFYDSQGWKQLRVTKHDHNPVHDAMGNAEAFKRLLDGERVVH